MDIYIVKPGDSLYSIAGRYGTSVQRIAELNQLSDPNRITVGMALTVPARTATPKHSCEFNAYAYPSISAEALDYALPYLTAICPFSRSVADDGTLRSINDSNIVDKAGNFGVMPFLTVTNLDGTQAFSSQLAHNIFTDEAIKNTLFDSIFAALQSGKYSGVNLNFEYIYPFDRENYSSFIAQLSEKLHTQGYYLVTAIAPKESSEQSGLLYTAHDYAAHGKYCDRVIIMTYDWGHLYSSPRAVSPVNRIEKVLSYALTEIPADKLLMGFSNYAYSWAIPWKQGDTATYLSNASAQALAVSTMSQVKLDAASQCAYFDYTDASGVRRQVWYEDAGSIRAQLELVKKYGIAGISCWTVTQLWKIIFELFGDMYEREQ